MLVTADRRARQRDALVEAAERRIAAHGLAALRARDLAPEIGVSLGALYNLVRDMDELVLRVGSRTLARLDATLAAASERVPADRPVDRLVAVALAYCAFARDNLELWRTLFEHRLAPGADLPDWSVQEQIRMFRHVVAPLALLMPEASDEERALLARTLFSAVHGVVAIGLEEKLIAVPRAQLEAQVERLVRLVAEAVGSRQ